MASEEAQRFLDRVHENVWHEMGLSPRKRGPEDDMQVARLADELLRRHLTLLTADEAEGFKKRFFDEVVRMRAGGASKYDDSFTINFLAGLADELERAGRESLGRQMPRRPLLGTLPTGRVNALTLLVPGTGEHVVLFESQFSTFAHLAATALADVLPVRRTADGGATFSVDREEVAHGIARRPESTRRFGELVRAYLETGIPAMAPYSLSDPVRTMWAAMLCHSVELFALGHEYGHILRGHLGERRPAAWLGGPSLSDPEEVAYSNQEEVEADAEGISLAIAAVQISEGRVRKINDPVGLGFLGADFYFTMTYLIERAIHVLRHGHEDRTITLPNGDRTPENPPLCWVRRLILRHLLERDAPDETRGARRTADSVQNIVELLWTDLRPQLVAAHQAGVRPLTRWQT
jgi:hypothetical protein